MFKITRAWPRAKPAADHVSRIILYHRKGGKTDSRLMARLFLPPPEATDEKNWQALLCTRFSIVDRRVPREESAAATDGPRIRKWNNTVRSRVAFRTGRVLEHADLRVTWPDDHKGLQTMNGEEPLTRLLVSSYFHLMTCIRPSST